MTPINLAIFASRETTQELKQTLKHALESTQPNCTIDILINGNKKLESDLTATLKNTSKQPLQPIRVWSIPTADKANTWNQHIHSIWAGNTDTIYIDGYVLINRDSVLRLQNTLQKNPSALGTSGAPSIGWSAKKIRETMKNDGGFHGNFCAISAAALARIREHNAKLPLGMYRVDALMGAFLAFGLSDKERRWQPKIYTPTTFDATWMCTEKLWYSPKDIASWYRRRERQLRGQIENSAIKALLTEDMTSFADLPKNIAALFETWKDRQPKEFQRRRYQKAKNYFLSYTPPLKTDLAPKLVYNNQVNHQ